MIQERRTFITDPFCVWLDATEWRGRQITNDFVVIDPQDRDLVGYVKARLLGGCEYLSPPNVVTSKDGDGSGQTLQPPNELPVRQFATGLQSEDIVGICVTVRSFLGLRKKEVWFD